MASLLKNVSPLDNENKAKTEPGLEPSLDADMKDDQAALPGSGNQKENNSETVDSIVDEDGDVEMQNRKREHQNSGFGIKNKKRRKLMKSAEPKNALMQLNELKPGLEYKFTAQDGPVHAPEFHITVEVNGQVFEGTGQSKKKAKQNAAEQALKSFVQFPNASEAAQALGRRVIDADFTSDSAECADAIFNSFESQKSKNVEITPAGTPECAKPSRIQTGGKNSVMLLNELKPGLKYETIAEQGDGNNTLFTMEVVIDGQAFQGQGRNKKIAKGRAATAVLQKLYKLDLVTDPALQPVMRVADNEAQNAPSALADRVAEVIHKKFSELTNGLKSPNARRKVLAGVVVTAGDDLENAQVVSIATGTKCINGEYISNQGLALNDCHAEVIARRSLVRYLYGQLDLLFDPNTAALSIFVPNDNELFKLRDGIKFHLYISTSPCGDARIFSPHEKEETNGGDKHPNRKARGQLRTKIESGEGTIPVKPGVTVQTWDGVLQGERLLTMSCSDKVCRWNVLGVQGSLLSHFIEPIFYHSLILGSLYHAEHLSRAVYGRISLIENLPSPYHLNRLLLSGISNSESRQPGKAPNSSVNWSLGDASLEVINAMTGKNEQGKPSRLCKQALFTRFNNLYSRIPSLTSRKLLQHPKLYSEAKNAVIDYQNSKQLFYKAFVDAGLGSWIEKPIEQDQFELVVIS